MRTFMRGECIVDMALLGAEDLTNTVAFAPCLVGASELGGGYGFGWYVEFELIEE